MRIKFTCSGINQPHSAIHQGIILRIHRSIRKYHYHPLLSGLNPSLHFMNIRNDGNFINIRLYTSGMFI